MTDTPPKLPPYTPRPVDAERALSHLRVVDFSHFIAGPFASLILGDLGAEVIKIEKPGTGDDFRGFRPQREGAGGPFLWTNRNKQSIVLDLTKPAAQQVARELIAKADVVVENFSAGVMQRYGLDYAAVSASNPRLVYCSVSAYDRNGPYAQRLGFDPITQAESGFMSLNGFPDRDPVRSGPSIMDVSTGMMASNAIMGALLARERTGKGQQVEVSLYENAMVMVGFHAMNHLLSGMTPNRFGNTSPDSAPMGVFQANDGPFYLACANDRTFHRLATEVIGRPDLAQHEDFASLRQRVPNRARLAEILAPIFAGKDRETWVAAMRAAGVPAGPVRTVPEAYAAPEARHLVSEIPHPVAGTVPNIASPLKLSGTPVVDPVAAPTLGQHTEAILTRVLGYDQARIATLKQAGVFGP
jgi:crotonobetainyl-CoA:carnitine CoA-transferase CaiB-like acyl-CoA transferase